ncbi:hypothetical protein ANN_23471 [Periplaneta americana]|uniref:Uncharacterized protein n=1 Tax=Periplaneta americana TaxID=6978 RepID=A0ABQ8SMD6_PERAM|nr:hypothetical protein ANN_23471 [Periplaneta americana]
MEKDGAYEMDRENKKRRCVGKRLTRFWTLVSDIVNATLTSAANPKEAEDNIARITMDVQTPLGPGDIARQACSAKFNNIKWKWRGHVTRLRDGRWTQKVTLWDPRIGKRSRERQRTRWADLIRGRVGSHWSSRARNRKDWKNLRRQGNIPVHRDLRSNVRPWDELRAHQPHPRRTGLRPVPQSFYGHVPFPPQMVWSLE